MGGESGSAEHFEVNCPHCKRSFEAELLTGTSPRQHGQRGFKCPHCRLFVPYEHGAEEGLAGTTK